MCVEEEQSSSDGHRTPAFSFSPQDSKLLSLNSDFNLTIMTFKIFFFLNLLFYFQNVEFFLLYLGLTTVTF